MKLILLSHTKALNTARGTDGLYPERNLKFTNTHTHIKYIYIYLYIYKCNMISITLSTSVTNLMFEINSIKFKNEFATTYICSFPSKISKKYGR